MIFTLLLVCLLGNVDPERLHDLTEDWEVHPTPILGGFHNLYNARIIHNPEDTDYPFKMWFFGYAAEEHNPGYPGGDAIYFARAATLDAWEVYAGNDKWVKTEWIKDGDSETLTPAWPSPYDFVPVLAPDPDAFDNMASGDPSVVYYDGMYSMAYSGVRFDVRPDDEGHDRLYLMDCVMGAVSVDGIHWERSKAPILIWPGEYENPWEIVDGKLPETPPDAYYGRYHRPTLLRDNDRWKLWFDYFHPGTFVSLGYAENTGDFLNPSHWTVLRADDKPLLKDWPNPSIVRINDTYYAFSDAPNYPPEMGGDGRQLTMATSPDGISWTVQGHIRPHGKASSHVPEALLLESDESTFLYLFYSWKPERISDAPWDFRYKEIRYMRKPVD